MTKKIKNVKLLLYICLAMILLNSCTEEREYLENNNRDLKFSKKPFKELLSFKDFNSAYQKVKSEKQRSIASRSAIEDEYNFTIVEDKEVKIIEVDNKTFYNILIQRDSASAAYFENLLLMVEKINNVDEVSAYIMKYATSNGLMVFVPENDKEITPLFGRYIQHCSTVCVPMCIVPWNDDEPCEAHPLSSSQCVASFQMCYDVCRDFYIPDGGGIDSSNGNSESSGGGADGAPPSDPTPPQNGASGAAPPPELLIDPVIEEEVELVPKKKPCELLNEMVNKEIYNDLGETEKTVLTNLLDLKSNVAVHRERMYVLKPYVFGSSINHNAFTESFSESELEGDGLYLNVGSVPVDVIMHSHWSLDKHLSTFSLDDIYQIYTAIVNGNIDDTNKDFFTSIVVTAHGTQYALKIKNKTSFVEWGNTFFANWNVVMPSGSYNSFKNKGEKIYYDKYGVGLGNTPEQIANNEKALTKFLIGEGVGLELYRANDTFSQFTKLSIPAFSNTVQETPCPN